ncbi:MAG: heparinase II/III family protein [Pseudomonadota bacterium]
MPDPTPSALGASDRGDRVRAADRWAAFRAGFGPRVQGFLSQPEPRLPGDDVRGRQLMAGNLRLGGRLVEANGRVPWDIPPPSEAFLEALHGFEWLDDLAAVGDAPARQVAQAWLSDWLRRYGRGRGPGWTPDLTGRRQIRWITHALFLMNGQETADGKSMFRALARQTGMLSSRWKQSSRGLPRFEALTGLIYSACALTGMRGHLRPALRALARECAVEIDPSGGIVTRNPEELLEVFTLLTWIAAILKETGKDPDPAVNTAILRIAPTLRSLRHADGGLARMHGGGRGVPGRLDQALAQSGVRPARVKGLAMGYARMSARQVSVVIDAAPPMVGTRSFNAHASTLAFEMTNGRSPIIVNCGSGTRFGPDWRRAGRATASHSTLSLQGYSSARLARGAIQEEPERQNLVEGPEQVDVQESQMKTADGIVLSHDGWRRTHGLIHLRSLTLDHDGSLLRGEDGLAAMTDEDRATFDTLMMRLPGDLGLRYAVRFHLHPDVRAEIDLGGTAVSIQVDRTETWVFRATGDTTMTLEPSVYLDAGRLRPRATKQIVLSGRLTGYGSAVSWSLAKPVGYLPAPLYLSGPVD